MDRDIVNNIKSLSVDMINEIGNGHPGIALSASPIIYTIYSRHLNYNTSDPKWMNRDRFVLSAGHGSSMLYATLFLVGYNVTLDDLKHFRNLSLPGHPEYDLDKGVECTTGALGEGFATSVGMALASKILSSKFSMPKKSKMGKDRSLIDYNVYTIVSDGDLMEGITYEAASLAGTLNLNNLIVLYDSNDVCLDGPTNITFTENVIDRFKSMGWYTDIVKDGLSVNDIDKAIIKAKESNLPSFIEVKTTLGVGSLKQGSNIVHGRPLQDDDIKQLKEKLNIPNEEFYVNNNALELFRKQINERCNKKYEEWELTLELFKKQSELSDERIKFLVSDNINFILPSGLTVAREDNSTLKLNNQLVNRLFNELPNVIVGSSDLAQSTKLYLGDDIVSPNNYNCKNIEFGVRENAMGAILNGLALSKFRPFGSTYLAFSDYLRPSLRQSCLMNLPVTYVFTHDSINIGYDGMTHEPIEQLASLRCMPNLYVYRPSDAKELIGCIYNIMNNTNPACLVLSKKDTKQFVESSVKDTLKGGYVLRHEKEKLHAIIISTGSEVEVGYNVAEELYNKYKLDIRVISMPCKEIFDKMGKEYQESIIPKGYRTIVIEAGSKMCWEKYVYNDSYLITLDQFGLSGKPKDVLKNMNFDYDSILERVKSLLLK